jgi:hypothetical protein
MAVAATPITDTGRFAFLDTTTAMTPAFPKMVESAHLAADRIGYLYSELVCVAW